MNSAQIIAKITTGSFTAAELRDITEALNFARSKVTRKAAAVLEVGMKVTFTNSKTGRTYTGDIIKVKQKYASVRTPEGAWNVPFFMVVPV